MARRRRLALRSGLALSLLVLPSCSWIVSLIVENRSDQPTIVTLTVPWTDSTYRTFPSAAECVEREPAAAPQLPIDSAAFRVDSAGAGDVRRISFTVAPNTALWIGRVVIAGPARVHAPMSIEIKGAGRLERLTWPEMPCRFRRIRGSLYAYVVKG